MADVPTLVTHDPALDVEAGLGGRARFSPDEFHADCDDARSLPHRGWATCC